MEIVKADTIEQYNRFFGFQTKHPLVGIVHFDRSIPQLTYRMTFGFYALFLKKRPVASLITARRSMILMMKPWSVSHRGRP